MKGLQIIGNWDDDLIWCPSQCYLKVKFNKNCYIIYLRWRWNDPWEMSLIPTDETFKIQYGNWLYPKYNPHKMDELEEFKRHCIKQVRTYLKIIKE